MTVRVWIPNAPLSLAKDQDVIVHTSSSAPQRRVLATLGLIEILNFQHLFPKPYNNKGKPTRTKVPFDSSIPVHKSCSLYLVVL